MINIGGWAVTASEDGQHLYIELDGAPGQIHIKAEDEGFVVDIWETHTYLGDPQCVATTSATYRELEPE